MMSFCLHIAEEKMFSFDDKKRIDAGRGRGRVDYSLVSYFQIKLSAFLDVLAFAP